MFGGQEISFKQIYHMYKSLGFFVINKLVWGNYMRTSFGFFVVKTLIWGIFIIDIPVLSFV